MCITYVQNDFWIKVMIDKISIFHEIAPNTNSLERDKPNCLYPLNLVVGTCKESTFFNFVGGEPLNLNAVLPFPSPNSKKKVSLVRQN